MTTPTTPAAETLTENGHTRSFARYAINMSAQTGETCSVDDLDVSRDYLMCHASEHTACTNELGRLQRDYRGIHAGRPWHVKVSH